MIFTCTHSDELYHHGILGQKWGKRNGPPYPLDYNAHSAAEKKENQKSKISGDNQNGNSKEHKGLTSRQKKLIVAGTAFVATAAVVGGTYYAYTHNDMFKDIFGNGKKFVDNYLNNEDENILSLEPSDKIKKLATETGLKLKSVKTNAIEDCRKANPNNIFDKPEYNNNCIPSSIAFVLRRMGLDVEALPISQDRLNSGFNNNEMGKTFGDLLRFNIDKPEIDTSSSKTVIKSIKSSIADLCDGGDGIGIFTVRNNVSGKGHAMAWEKRNNKISLYDPLIGNKVNSEYFKGIANGTFGDILNARLDDLQINGSSLTEFFVKNSR